jgi:hypothetical protein
MVLKLAQPLEFTLELLFQLALVCRHVNRPWLCDGPWRRMGGEKGVR